MLWKFFLVATFLVGVFCQQPLFNDQQNQSIHDYMEKHCTKNNATDKTSQAEAAIHNFVGCISEHHDPSIFIQGGDISDKESVISVYRRVCTKVPELKTCLFILLDDTAVCGGKNATEEINKGKKFLHDLLEYLCGNDAEKFAKFVNDDSLTCLTEKKEPLKNCSHNLMKDSGSSEENSDEPSSAELKEACGAFNDLSKCLHTTLVECPKNTTSEFFDGIAELVRKASRCNSLD